MGARPAPAHHLIKDLKAANADAETISAQLQNWYNINKGKWLQSELLQLYTRRFAVHKGGIESVLPAFKGMYVQ